MLKKVTVLSFLFLNFTMFSKICAIFSSYTQGVSLFLLNAKVFYIHRHDRNIKIEPGKRLFYKVLISIASELIRVTFAR